MLEAVRITEDILDRASDFASTTKRNEKMSIRKHDGAFIGAVGAVAVADFYGVALEDQPEYDMIIEMPTRTIRGREVSVDKKISVKTKQRRVGPPAGYYEASVTKESLHVLNPDYFVFVSLYKLEIAYIMGMIEVNEFAEKARFVEEGVIDTTNGYRNRKACYNLAYEELNDKVATA